MMFVGAHSARWRPRALGVPGASPASPASARCDQQRNVRNAGVRAMMPTSQKRSMRLNSLPVGVLWASASASAVETDVDPKIIDGKAMARQVEDELAAEVTHMKETNGLVPGLAVIIVGERKDSQTYVRAKRKACERVGIASFGYDLPEATTQHDLEVLIEQLNVRADVHGILVQLPLPSHIDSEVVLDKISYEKDVDGFHPLNMGRLCMAGGGREEPRFVPCTPKGCIEMLKRKNVAVAGKNAVVLGRSNIVGLPAAMLLNQMDATVTICHSKTQDLAAKVRDADILVAAVGRAQFVPGDWIKPGAVVIDVGINAVEDASKKSGYRLVGDVDYASCYEKASLITPVPGGVGPMTIAMLLRNTVDGAARSLE
ncbi:Bifunctional protein FolD 2 [Porphyridium purpureum]|uniref:Bifunctional protein FolD 2 n=1 Tax=Porphyridium purpureum TaxID=35688 RepID=A0A5J4Z0E9_PORPP|nr:Bifunctional protein FolD 2 [Porphyridium purpureum]|eukprot:POR2735..scf208_2